MGYRLAYVHALEVDDVVNGLDLVHLFFGETAPQQAHPVHAFEHNGFPAGQRIGGDILGQFGLSRHETVCAHP